MALSDKKPVPQHIAIIMDGNGRWAKQRGLPRTAGHAAGAESFRRIANYCRTLGVRYLTVYAFSTENWKRSEEEVSGIMRLLGKYLKEALADMEKNKVCFRFFGDLSRLSPELQKLCEDAVKESKDYDVQVNFCLNYGGRDEIVRAGRAFAADVAEGKFKPEDLTEELLSKSVFGGCAGSGADHSSLRRDAHQQFPALAERILGICIFECSVARFWSCGSG